MMKFLLLILLAVFVITLLSLILAQHSEQGIRDFFLLNNNTTTTQQISSATTSAKPTNTGSQVPLNFKGPTGSPHIIGPSSPPPDY